jgi:epoxyqueuosine reductase
MQTCSSVPFHDLKQLAHASGLEVVGASLAAHKPLESSRLKLWQDQGYAAELSYMLRDPLLQSDPLRLLPEAKSVLSFSVSYDTRPAPEFSVGFGKVARYAWGRDYHLILPPRIEHFVGLVKEHFGEFKFRVFTDAVPLLERAFAASAGLGFIGKNTLLIRPKHGSFTLLAELLCDFEVSGFTVDSTKSSCGTCHRCIDACPTNAFKSEYVLDAGRCISYLSIEKKGILSIEERKMLGEWIFGCDICQEVCPFNHGSLKLGLAPSLGDFSPEFGAGPLLNLSEG